MESGRFLPIKIGEGGFYFGKDDLFFLLRNCLPDKAASRSAFPIPLEGRPLVHGRSYTYIMKSRLAVSLGGVVDWERRHSSEGVRGDRVLGRRFSRAFLGRLSFGPSPGVLGPDEFLAWPLGWAGWLGEPSPSPW